jgi:YVTN family beta-propeller protein
LRALRGEVRLGDVPEAPRGAVTFLFTDIEGSTRLVKLLRDRYRTVLSDHQRLLRAAFVAHDGYEVDTQGDSFFVAFASAREALLAAVDAQRSLGAHAWPDGVEIKVRMGLHTGQATAHDGRYTGLAVHRAARIGSAAYGGQILVSQATQTLLEDEEEDLDVVLRDLGDQSLKDLDRPVRLYQAVADGLADSFPAPRGDVPPGQDAAPRGWWREHALALGVGVALALAAVLALGLMTRPGSGGSQIVEPNHLGVIDPRTNDVVSQVPVGVGPGPVAVGGGAVWVGNVEDRTLSRVNPVERTVARTIPLADKTPTGVAVGLDAVWVAHGVLGEVSRIDPQFDRVTDSTAVGGSAFGAPYGTIAVDTSSVWAVFSDSTLAQLDAQGRTLGEALAGTQPAGIDVGEGAVWVSNFGDATVYRFDPATFEEGPVRSVSVSRQPIGIAVSSDAVWVACSGDDAVTRIDPTAYSTTTIPVPGEPVGVAVGPDAVWVASRSGTVSRIDPATNEVVATIDVGGVPTGVAAGLGYVWVTVQAPGVT